MLPGPFGYREKPLGEWTRPFEAHQENGHPLQKTGWRKAILTVFGRLVRVRAVTV
ncbi:hypothetical protein HMPREF9440_01007 [Sutterella parvirubra YIT 11816]|uniref:Uncharacterized protein n=1 Tax=Sutterella parvirubra YIT 11816 TaxID=762967 RepID=H3KE46_9BURK|nr:hypothetical protein HMPREF9440_01007 [Sutterella parvirubra YIT 11816]